MFKSAALFLSIVMTSTSAELGSKKTLNLSSVKTMVAAAEAEAQKRDVHVSICVVDESGNLLFFQKGEGSPLNTIEFAQRKARHAAFYGSPSRVGAETIKKGDVQALAFPQFFPNQGGLPIKIDGVTIGAISASGAKSEIDEAIAQSGIDALMTK